MSAVVYEEVGLDEMMYNDSEQMYYYECPCGDKFEISLEDLYDGEDIAPCPSCTLQIKVLFEESELPELRPEEEEEEEHGHDSRGGEPVVVASTLVEAQA
ncbi:unnamed protein product [Ectocarpus sp. 12 AP-2014]